MRKLLFRRQRSLAILHACAVVHRDARTSLFDPFIIASLGSGATVSDLTAAQLEIPPHDETVTRQIRRAGALTYDGWVNSTLTSSGQTRSPTRPIDVH